MTLIQFAKQVEKFTIDNSPLLLTAVGVTGTVMTAYLTGKASFKAAEIIRSEEQVEKWRSEPHTFTKKEKVNLVWKEFIPAVGMGVVTIASIVGANQIGTRRAAAMAAAYSISERAFTEYKDKVEEKIGKNKAESIRDDIMQDRVNANPKSQAQIIVTPGGDHTIYEKLTGRYFTGSIEQIKKAQNDLNYRLNHDFSASLSDLYDLLDWPHTSISDELGWNSDRLLEIEFSPVLGEDGQPCIGIDYAVEPVRKYFRHG